MNIIPRTKSAGRLFFVLVALGAIAILTASFFLGKSSHLITSDGNACYAWLPTLIIDKDLDFENNFRSLYSPDQIPDKVTRSPSGNLVNKCPIGMAIVEFPAFAVGHAIAVLSSADADGASMPYQICVVAWLLAVYVFCLYLFYLSLTAYGVNNTIALFFAGMAIAGTNLVHYIAKEPSMPHALDVALISLAIYIASRRSPSIFMDLLGGLVAGLLLITRNATIAVIPLLLYLHLRNAPSVKRAMVWIIGPIALYVLNAAFFHALWGSVVFRTYRSEGFTGGWTGMWSSLFSGRHGLFVYHPWYLLLLAANLIGFWKMKKERVLYSLILFVFVALWIFNGTWWCWWFGTAFGNRAFIECLIPLTFGAALLIQNVYQTGSRIPWRFAASMAALLVLLNLYLWSGFLLHRYSLSGKDSAIRTYTWPIHARK